MIKIGGLCIPLQFHVNGYEIFLNHLISFVFLATWLIWACRKFNVDSTRDKALHAAISFLLTFILVTIFNLIGWVWWIAPIIVMLIGLGKEVADLVNPKKRLFDKMDLVADAYGIVTIIIIYYVSFVCFVKLK